MFEKIVVGQVTKGLKTDRLPYNIDNDSFPSLINAYEWRGRVKRKRGTTLLGRLTRYFNSTSTAYNSGSTTITLNGSGIGNLLTGFSLETNGNIVPGTVTITDTNTSIVYTDLSLNGTLSPSGTINYATGQITIVAAAGDSITASFNYYPDLPVMGFRDLNLTATQFPLNIAFDTTYSYNVTNTEPTSIYDVSFYKNPTTGSYPGYTQKSAGNITRVTWNGQNYQQFWTVNYQGAFWATNGINIPFSPNSLAMQFAPSSTITFVSQTATTITVTITNCPLVIGDFVFFNEWTSVTPANATTLNLQTSYVTASSINTLTAATKTITITFPNAAIATDTYIPGIIQYLTNRSDTTKDCIRWYDGDPTNGQSTPPGSPPVLTPGFGWVNFMPPLSNLSYSIADTPLSIYYLIGARIIFPFKDRLVFFGPVIQNSTGTKIYLPDTIIYSQNGTAFYTASFTGNPLFVTTVFNAILVPMNQTATAPAYFEDSTGFGGFISAGTAQPIIGMSPNEDTIVIEFSASHARLVYSGNDIVPFNFYIVNSELGGSSTFSVIPMDKGILSKGNRGFILANQVEARRFDLEIPDQVFQISNINNGNERVTAQRDFINEWIYFTYTVEGSYNVFPNQTLFYNYREDSWAIFNESYTCYGQFRPATGYTWATVGLIYSTWNKWDAPWSAGQSELLQPNVAAGNQQGFILLRDNGTGEAESLYIQGFLGNTVTSPNHNLNNDDYIVIDNALGAIGSQVNGNVFSVFNVTTTTFMLNPSISSTGTDYLGAGTITHLYVPFIQTKQFPVSWGGGRKTRISKQQYLFSKTDEGQITLQIYLSQNANDPYNDPPIVPTPGSINNSLVYSQIVYTSPELYMQNCNGIPLGNVGDGVTLTYTFDYLTLFTLITTSLVPGSVFISVGNVATFTDNGTGGFTATGTGTSVGSSISYTLGIITIAFTVAPTAQVSTTNFQYYVPDIQNPIAGQQAQIWHRMNTSLIGDTVQLGFTLSDAQMRDPTIEIQTSEIELLGFILDVTSSSLLA